MGFVCVFGFILFSLWTECSKCRGIGAADDSSEADEMYPVGVCTD